MTVEQAIERLMEQPMNAELAICGHEWNDGLAWYATDFAPTEDGAYVLVEGAQKVPCPRCE